MKGFLTRNKLLIVIGLLAVLGIAGGLTVLHYYRLLASPNIHVAEGEVALNIPDADWDTHDVICALSEKADIRNVRALEKAMEDTAKERSTREYYAAQARLARAINRLKVKTNKRR